MPQLIKFIEINILSDSLEYLNLDFMDKPRLSSQDVQSMSSLIDILYEIFVNRLIRVPALTINRLEQSPEETKSEKSDQSFYSENSLEFNPRSLNSSFEDTNVVQTFKKSDKVSSDSFEEIS